MQQMTLFDAAPRWTVTTVTKYMRQLLDSDSNLQGIWVQGEISNLSQPASGHVYFTLKDSEAALRCVIWRMDAARLRIDLQDGMAIEAHGRISIYETSGQYQLYADTLQPLGEGVLYQEFLRIKAILEKEGLFETERKRSIPDLPRRIGVVTSPTGAALRDILNTLRRRLPLAEVILSPTPVQGSEAPAAIVAAMETLNEIGKPDVILLTRGGGSIEDLWAFNDERVVRGVSASVAPVITGVGHETDFTLVDFASDLRAPTPTGAAELATPITSLDLKAVIEEKDSEIRSKLISLLEEYRDSVNWARERLRLVSPGKHLQTEKQRLDEIVQRLNFAQNHQMEMTIRKFAGMQERVRVLNPLAILSRGYAVVSKETQVITSPAQVNLEDKLNIRVKDGVFNARVAGEA